MSQVLDSWKNARGETVELVGGQLRVRGTNGHLLSGAAVNARRCDGAASQASMAMPSRSVQNADANGVVELPFMAIKPYYLTK